MGTSFLNKLCTLLILRFVVVCQGMTSGMSWNWGNVIELIKFWNVPQFDVTILTPLHDVRWKKDFLPTGKTSTTFRFNEVSDAFIGERWNNFKNPFIITFHLCYEEKDFLTTLQAISYSYNFTRRSRRASGSIYNFIILSNPLPPFSNSTHLCHHLLRNDFFRFTHFRVNTNIFIFESQDVLLEIYSIKTLKFCNRVTNLNFEDIVNRLARRRDFQNARIIATAAVEKSTEFEVRYEEVNGTIVSADGLAVNIFKDMEYTLKFKGLYIHGDWVLKDHKGQPAGKTVDQLRNGSADVCITQTTLASYRAIGLNYLQPTFQDGLFAFLQQPPSSSVKDVHISPFQTNQWMTVFAVWFILGTAFYLFTYFRKSCKNMDVGLDRGSLWRKKETIYEAFSWSIGAVCNQGHYMFPKQTSSRIVVLCGAFFGLMVYIMYSGSIISSLTSETQPIQSFVDLLKSSLDIYVDQSSTTIQRIVYSLKKVHPRAQGFHLSDEGVSLAKVIKKPAALFAFSRNFYRNANSLNISASTLCASISKIPILELPLQNAMLVARFSPYRESLNWNIMEMKERGLVARYLKHFIWESTSTCSEKKVVYRENLGLQDVFTAFAIFLSGYGISVLVFFLERWQSKCAKCVTK